ncbi:hypothetical protein [Martelella mediterranea]|uniref:Outer membrane lipoprotein n=1 Tax=Martelella mediterranea TaxID=293089 RepID=A0A4R3NUV3_9HYPH|nr:hypothetical protein [Martelella mediterranea]TCT40152.1 hypothetical protein EDC90_10103 [Martelella mediterranea]
MKQFRLSAHKKTIRIAAVAGAVIVAGCSTYSTPQYNPGSVRPQVPTSAIDGRWLDKNGIISNFSAGRFETRTADSNQILATGSYTEVAGNVVEIDLTSVLRQTRSRVNCSVISDYLMNCTPSQGDKFSLYKPSTAPYGFTLADAPAAIANAANANGQQVPGQQVPGQPVSGQPMTGQPAMSGTMSSPVSSSSMSNTGFPSTSMNANY